MLSPYLDTAGGACDAAGDRQRHGTPTLLDLNAGAFARLAPLSRGVLQVAVRW